MAGCNNDTSSRLLFLDRTNRAGQRGMIQFPMARGTSHCDQPPRPWKGIQQNELSRRRFKSAGRIADRKRQGEKIGSGCACILRRCDLEIEIIDAGTGVTDVDEFAVSAGLAADVSRHRDAAVARADHQIGPGRPDQIARTAVHNGEVPAQKRDVSQRIVGDRLGFERKVQRVGQRKELIVVADAIAEKQPDQRLPGENGKWRLKSAGHAASSAHGGHLFRSRWLDFPQRLWMPLRRLALLLPPAAEHRERVEQAAMVGETAAMLIEQPLHLVSVEEGLACGAG